MARLALQTSDNPNIEFQYNGKSIRLNLNTFKEIRYTPGHRDGRYIKENQRKNVLWRKKHPFKSRFFKAPFYVESWHHSGKWYDAEINFGDGNNKYSFRYKSNAEAEKAFDELKTFLYRQISY